MHGELILSEETVRENITHLNELREKNRLLKRVYKQETTFETETRDLFSFFEDPYVGLKLLLWPRTRSRALKEDHDERLSKLERVLNGVDLTTENEAEEYSSAKRALLEMVKIPPEFLSSPGLSFRERLGEKISRYEGLAGRLDTSILHEKPLRDAFGSDWGIILMYHSLVSPAFLVAAGVLGYGKITGDTPDEVGIALLGIMGIIPTGLCLPFFLKANYMPYRCELPYTTLKEKAHRMDIFTRQYLPYLI